MIDFKEFGKIHRLYREIIITEKIDGTNACIINDEHGFVGVQSRSRVLTKETDNFGFWEWANKYQDDLAKLGKGYHYGEWWGNGIQRGYGMPKGVRRFSLFNTTLWHRSSENYRERPACCEVVPILYQGVFSEKVIQECLDDLRSNGSKVAPFMDPEGIVIHHVQSRTNWKITLDGDGHKNDRTN